MNAGISCPYFAVDVFSARAGTGNPLAVLVDGSRFDDDRMQAIAAWNNLAETTFLFPPQAEGADYRVRIFTTQREIAFAGHPSIGSAHVARAMGLVKADATVLMQECQAGLLPVQVGLGAAPGTLSVRVPRSRIVRRAGPQDVELERALAGAKLGELAPALVEGGRRWWLAELADVHEVRRLRPDQGAIRELARATDSLGLCVFARTPGREQDVVVRAFPLGVGIVEDPASGAANAAIAAFLDETGSLGSLAAGYRVSQGREMGRDAKLELRLDEQRQVWVGGQCQTVVRGSFRW